MAEMKKGYDVIVDEALNKSVGFSREEREKYGLRGLLPYAVLKQGLQEARIMHNLRRKATDIERYLMLSALQDRNERLYYRTVIDNIEEVMPLIYTPTVGQACKKFSHNFRRTKGFYINPTDKGRIYEMLDNWPDKDIRVIVVTDGERILGLGDLGADGMGIPVGKLALYTACAGIHPSQCLPVMLDVGTNNEALLDDVLYLGYPQPRLKGGEYDTLVAEFVNAIQKKYPKALIQFEDFLTPNAYKLMNRYKDRVLCFNDDIQGTASVALAGLYASTRITNKKFKDMNFMFLGAGSAATGIADLIVVALQKEGLSREQAYSRLSFVDVHGLVVKSRHDVGDHCKKYAQDKKQLQFLDAIDEIKPDVLIGASGAPKTFTETVVQKMCKYNKRPVIFALSNPTSKAECTAEQAYTWSDGKAIFASGSPFDPVFYKDQIFKPGQGNNAYIFPALGLAGIICEASTLPDELFYVAAKALAKAVRSEDINQGALYPALKHIRHVSLQIATEVVEEAYKLGVAKAPKPKDIYNYIREYMYDPTY